MEVTMKDYSLTAMLDFFQQLVKDAPEKDALVRNWRTACRSVIGCLPPALQEDVRGIDPDEAMQTYKRANPDSKEKTCKEYHRRLKQSLAEFLEAPDASQAPRDIHVPESTTAAPLKQVSKAQSIKVVLRTDFIAELAVPFDITEEEASLMSRYLSLAAEGSSRLR